MTQPLKERLADSAINPDGPEALARIEVLEKALKPFAQAAAARDGQEDYSITETLVVYLRAARSSLNEGG